jgi:hypothetical protein
MVGLEALNKTHISNRRRSSSQSTRVRKRIFQAAGCGLVGDLIAIMREAANVRANDIDCPRSHGLPERSHDFQNRFWMEES